ncbi:histidine--tRNA ligase [candidate division KSB1 bacterium]|nr:histidine--tRNA ligase [candidate division KSB1 bacterium]
MKYKSLTGTRDVLPEEQPYWRYIEKKIIKVTSLFGFVRVDPPIFEETALFARGVGEGTDIVEKEMYTFQDKGKKSITLRPEFTAGFMRLYLQNGLYVRTKPVKLYSVGPIFRYERPQAGRFRQHTQFNVEALGEQDPSVDVEVLSLAHQLYTEIGFKDITFQLNSTGCPQCRPAYIQKLRHYYTKHSEIICPDCQRRLDKNTLRLLDCKVENCQPVKAGAPVIRDHLCLECQDHFSALLHYLDLLDKPYSINHTLVRGLDYYTKTVFEVWAQGIGSQSAMCGGGRYDGLIEQLGGPPTPGIGFGSGIERIIISMQEQDISPEQDAPPRAFLIHAGKEAKNKAIQTAFELRQNGFPALFSFTDRSIKAQLREANKFGAHFAVIIGDQELEQNAAAVKNLKDGTQSLIAFSDLLQFFQNIE